ncbi:MAG: glycosyltransferase family 4 protein [bacterium]|nr:glycosyltransferase family 4 protein [bacterium]
MNIAMVVHSYYPADVRVRRECEALADRKDTVHMICLQKSGEPATEQIGNVTVFRLPVQHQRGQGPAGYIREYLSFFLRAFIKLTRLYVKHRYPIVQVHNMPDFLVFVTLVPKIMGAKVLLDMHDVTPELFQSLYGISHRSPTFALLRFVEQMSLAYADAVLTVNKNIRDLFLTRNPIARTIEVVMNAPDPRYFTPMGSGVFPPNGTFKLFHHGQLLRRYSIEVALEAVEIASRDIPGLELDIYGDGEEQYIHELHTFVAEHGLTERIRFHGRVPVEQVPALIHRAHLGLVPCKKDVFVDKVMLPVRLLEYVVMGLPSVVARVGTVQTYFTEDEVAYYPPHDAHALAQQIVELYRNPQRSAAMAHRAQAAFRSYEWPQMQKRYYRVLDGLLSK